MKSVKRFFARLRNLGTSRRGDARLNEEIESHVAFQTDENIREGLSPVEARRRAVLKFGAVEAVKEEYREERRTLLIENIFQDIRYALRILRKSPGFAAVAILTIALGIGATTAIFSVVDAALLHPLPYPHPEQLVKIVDDLPGVGVQDVGMSVPEWHDLERSGIFERVSPLGGGGSINLTGATQPTRASFLNIAPNYFALLGVKPEFGRTFNPDDQTPGFTLEVVISDGLWKGAFGGDPQILGKSLRLDNDLYQVVGVMPASHHGPGQALEERNTEIWAASGFAGPPAPAPLRNSRFLVEAIGRLKPGLTIAAAQSRVDALVAALQKQFPDEYPSQHAWAVRLVPLKESVVGNVRQSLVLLLGAVGLVTLIGCVNVANLLLARASARGREMAVRQALGASGGRLIRQLLTESFLLAALGGIGGVAILLSAKEFLLRILPDSLPRLSEVSISWPVLLFALAASLVAGAIFGVAPALQAGRLDLTGALKREGRGSTGSGEQVRTRRVLVAAEFALSLVLMIAAGLLLRSFWELLTVQPGFSPQNVMSVRTWLPIPNDPATDIYRTVAQEAVFIHDVLDRGKTLMGVEEIAVGDVSALPLGHGRNDLKSYPLIIEGHERPANESPWITASIVTPGYFHLLGMTLLRGRLLNEFDSGSAPLAAVINESFARTYWPNENPVGKRIKMPTPGDSSNLSLTTIVGVLADVRAESLADSGKPQMYLSMFQRRAKDLAIFLRGKLDPATTPVDVRRVVQSVNPELPVFGAQTLDEVVAESLSQRRFSMEMVGMFALTALLLAGMGIYGVISYMVNERTHEIGIRLALGAQRADVLRMVLRYGLGLAVAGTVIGLAGSVIVSRLMGSLLYGVSSTDPITFGGVAVLLIGIALVGCYVPARRAMKVDPIVALRHE
jgi:predicted permease